MNDLFAFAQQHGCRIVEGSKHYKLCAPNGRLLFVLSRKHKAKPYDLGALKRKLVRLLMVA